MVDFSSSQDTLQAEFEALATTMGWPSNILQQVKVKAQSEGISYDVPSDIQEQVNDLEYGKFENPPKPAMRRTERLSEDLLLATVENQTVDKYLIDTGLF